MGIVAVHAGFLQLSDMAFNYGHVLLFVAFETQLGPLLYQQTFLIRLMSVVTGRAFPVANRIVFKSRLREIFFKILMALEAELAIRLAQQFLLVGGVGLVARGTFPILDWLMLNFCRGKLLLNCVVAFKAKFAIWLQKKALRI